MQTKKTNGVHISDSIYSLVWEQIAPDYIDRYLPPESRRIDDGADDLRITQPMQAVQS